MPAEGPAETPATDTSDTTDAPAFTKDDLAVLDDVVGADGDDAEDADEEDDADSGGDPDATNETEPPDPGAVPEDASGYQMPEVSGFNWDEGQTAAAQPYLEALHEAGATQEQAAAALSVYAVRMVSLAEHDARTLPEARAALQKEWGDAYKPNIDALRNFMDTRVDPAIATALTMARLPNGGRLINNSQFANLLLTLAKGQRGENGMDEMAELQAAMDRDVGDFQNKKWKGTDQTGSERMLALQRQRDSSNAPAPSTPSAREWEIEKIRDTNIDRYVREGLGEELLKLMRARTGER